MNVARLFSTVLLLAISCFGSANGFAQDTSHDQHDDWARWRGPTGNGIAAPNQKPPTRWDEDTNVVWKSKVPGRGHASPVIVEGKIFLATSDTSKQTQSVLCFDRATGKQLWQTEINQGGFNRALHPNNSQASPTIATDRKSVFVVFNNHDSVQLAALDFDGNELWKKKVCKFQSGRPFGYGSSPIIYDGKVIVTSDTEGEPAIVAMNTKNGDEIWRIKRPGKTNYSTPVVADVAGKKQLLISGNNAIISYNPDNGQQNWKTSADWEVTCGTMVWNNDTAFASGGFPPSQTLAVKADGSGKVAWENRVKVYEQSMLYHDGYVYAHSDNTVIYCWRASDGNEMWQERFSKRRIGVSASPVLANGNIYFTAENGQTIVAKSNPEKFEEVARNKLGDESFASMAVCGNQIFTRVSLSNWENGSREEWLFCLGE